MIGRFTLLSWAQGTDIIVTNPQTGDGNFTFYTNEISVGTRFNATVWTYNVTDLFAYQVSLNVDDTLLNITRAWSPTWNTSWVLYGKTTVGPPPAFYDLDTDGYMESVKIGDTILVGETFTGDGLLAIIEFEIIHAPASGSVSCNLDIDYADTYLLDYDLTEITPITKMNGYYEFNYVGVPAGLLQVEPSFILAIARGEIFTVNVTISDVDASSRLVGIDFRLSYNASFVSVLNITEGSFLSAFPQGPDPPFTQFMGFDEAGDPLYGDHVVVGDLLLPNATGDYPGPFPEGEGTVATITFNVTGLLAVTFDLELFDTMLIDDEITELPHTLLHGHFELKPLMLEVTPSSYIASRRGETFDISINIGDVDASSRLVGIQFRLSYNASFVSVLNITEGSFLSAFPQGPDPPFTQFMGFDEAGDPLYGDHVVVGDLLLPNATGDYPGPFPEGEGTVATITFNVTGVTGTFDFELFDTMQIDDEITELPHALLHGYFERVFNVTITDQPKPSYNRTAVAAMKFIVQYGDGTYYAATDFGSITVDVHNGTDYVEDVLLAATDFNSLTNEWTAKWVIPSNAPMLDNYTFVIRANEVVDKFGDTGSPVDVISDSFNVTELPSIPFKVLDVQVDVGSIYFNGEQAEFYILITLDGIPVDATAVTAVLHKPDETAETLNAVHVATGLYKAIYTVATTNPSGTYALIIQASYTRYDVTVYGASLKSFQISSTLAGWDPMIKSINGTIATIETTLGEIQLDLEAINATLYDIIIDEHLAVIDTTLGTITADLEAINATLYDIIIDEHLAVIDTTLGTIKLDLDDINATLVGLIINSKDEILAEIDTALGPITTKLDDIDAKIVSIDGNVVTIDTTLGEVQTTLEEIQASLGGVQSATNTTLYAASILSAIAAVIGIIILLLMRKK